MYAKLVAGELIAAPEGMAVEDANARKMMERFYTALGYLPVVETPAPDDGGYYTERWEKQEGEIVRVWDAVELSPAQRREIAYDNTPAVAWNGETLTVSAAARQWSFYAAEGDEDKTRTLTALIAAAKEKIREEYPDAD